MKKIAITGNIASGKSLLEAYFKKSGNITLCLDKVTDEIYKDAKFQESLKKIFNTTNRNEISNIVFSNKAKLKTLEGLILPLIKQKMFNFFDENKNEKIVFVCAPTLFEAGFEIYFDEIIFVSASENIRKERLIKRNKLSCEKALNKINSQIKECEKIPKCNYIIENNGTKEEFLAKIDKLKAKLNIP